MQILRKISNVFAINQIEKMLDCFVELKLIKLDFQIVNLIN